MRKKTVVRQYMQYRAEDLKSLTEQRADLVQQMKDRLSRYMQIAPSGLLGPVVLERYAEE